MPQPSSTSFNVRGDTALLLAMAFSCFLIHLLTNIFAGYGIFRDEFYYIACSDHLAFGYVDQPSLSILLLAVNRFLFGDSVVALRLLPAAASAGTVFLTGKLAGDLGGGRFAKLLAALCTLIVPTYLVVGNYYSMNAFDILFWTVAMLIVVRILTTGNQKLWLWFGVTVGLGAENKYSILFLCFGIVVGLLISSERRQLLGKWFWPGTTVAGLLFLPHVIWEIANSFPTAEFIRNATLYKNVQSTPLEFFTGQIDQMSPFLFPVWAAGLLFFFLSKKGKQFRLFGWCYAAIFVVFVLQHGKPYYLTPIYPIVLAAGAVAIGDFITVRHWNWLRPAVLIIVGLSGIMIAPLVLPILPVDREIAYAERLGNKPRSEERKAMGKLPQHYADMFGWEDKVAAVARAYNTLAPDEKAKCAIYTNNYGRAGAIDYYSEKYGLPKSICSHNNYWLWGPRDYTGEIVLVLANDMGNRRSFFRSVELMETIPCKYCMPYEDSTSVFLCRGLKQPLKDLWPKMKSYE